MQKLFEKNRYCIVKDAISKELRDFVTQYALFDEMQNLKLGDLQAPNSHSKYADPTMETMLLHLHSIIEKNTGLSLYPTYSYYRVYRPGDDLKKHKDRPSCEISMTLCLGYDIMNLPKDQQDWNWPMWVHSQGEDKEIFMKPGDGIIYRGCDVEHWRLPYIGNNHAQVFLHYNSELENKFDNRPYVGLPGSYRSK